MGPGNWNSGRGVVHVSVISANRALSPDRVDCQWPHKVSQVHSRGKVLLPRVTDSFFFSPLCSILLASGSSVQSFCWVELCSLLSLENLAPCLFVCVSEEETNRETICVCMCDREWQCFFLDRCLNGFSRALLNGKPPPVVFVHKEALLSWKGTIELFTESQRAQTTLLQPWRMLSHIAPSLCLGQCLSALSNTTVGLETMVILSLLFLFWMPSVKLKVNVCFFSFTFSFSFSNFGHNSLHTHYVSWGKMNKVYVTLSHVNQNKNIT